MSDDPLSLEDVGESQEERVQKSARVSRRMNEVLEKVSDEIDESKMEVASQAVMEEVGEVGNEAYKMRKWPTLVRFLDKTLPYEIDRLESLKSFSLGELDKIAGYEVYESNSAVLGRISNDIGLNGGSTVVRICIIRHTHNLIDDGEVDLPPSMKREIVDKSEEIELFFSDFKRQFEMEIKTWFVDMFDRVERHYRKSTYDAVVFNEFYDGEFEGETYDYAVEVIGEEPFNNIEEVLEGVMEDE